MLFLKSNNNKINEAIEAFKPKKESFSDDRIYKISKDKEGNGSVLIRFIPVFNEPKTKLDTFITKKMHSINNERFVNGKKEQKWTGDLICPSQHGDKDCPICTYGWDNYEEAKETYGKTDVNGKFIPAKYDPNFRTQTSIDENVIKYMPIVTPVDADKTQLFSINELSELADKYSLEQLKNPTILAEYQSLLDSIYYPKSMNNEFVGLNGENFGPQQIMDKRYDKASLSIQAVTSILFGQEGDSFTKAIETQDYISKQKWNNLKVQVLNKINEQDDASYSQFIIDTANELDSDPYTIRALINGEMP
jgi:hypothetical protein